MQKVEVKFRGVRGGTVGKVPDAMADRKNEPQAAAEEWCAAPIRDALKRLSAPKTIDCMSLDIEGAEHLVTKNFPFDEHGIEVLTVERPSARLKTLLGFNGCVMVRRLAQ